MSIHKNSFPCIVCPEHFASKLEQADHLAATHNYEAAWLCHQCSNSFEDSNQLEDHVTTTHPCPKGAYGQHHCSLPACGTSFATEKLLIRHRQQDHTQQGARNGKGLARGCTQRGCNYTNDSCVAYSQHLLHIHPPTCAVCGTKFEEFAELVKHRAGLGKDGACAPSNRTSAVNLGGADNMSSPTKASTKNVTVPPLAPDYLLSTPSNRQDWFVSCTDYQLATASGQDSRCGHGVGTMVKDLDIKAQHSNTALNGQSDHDWNASGRSSMPSIGSETQLAPFSLPQGYNPPSTNINAVQSMDSAALVQPESVLVGEHNISRAPTADMDVYDPLTGHLLDYAYGDGSLQPSDELVAELLTSSGPACDVASSGTFNKPALPSSTPYQQPQDLTGNVFVPNPPLPQSVYDLGFNDHDFDPSRIWLLEPLRRNKYCDYPGDISDNHVFNGNPNLIAFGNILELATRFTNSDIFRRSNANRVQPVFDSKATIDTRIKGAIRWTADACKISVDAVEARLNAEKIRNGLKPRQKKRKRGDDEQTSHLDGNHGTRAFATPKKRLKPNEAFLQPQIRSITTSTAEPSTPVATMTMPAPGTEHSLLNSTYRLTPATPASTASPRRASSPERPDTYGLRGSVWKQHLQQHRPNNGIYAVQPTSMNTPPTATVPAIYPSPESVIDLTSME